MYDDSKELTPIKYKGYTAFITKYRGEKNLNVKVFRDQPFKLVDYVELDLKTVDAVKEFLKENYSSYEKHESLGDYGAISFSND